MPVKVEGGRHPRKKTIYRVKGIGLDKVEQIFYRALTTYFTRTTSFAKAKIYTAQAANELYGPEVERQVNLAWCAVGVGKCNPFNFNIFK